MQLEKEKMDAQMEKVCLYQDQIFLTTKPFSADTMYNTVNLK